MTGEMVVGYDGSECAKEALRVAVGIARCSGVGVMAVFASEPPAALAGSDDQRRALLERGGELVEEAESLVGGSVPFHGRVVDEKPAPGLNMVADEVSATMIVVGTYSEGPLAAALVGSTPHKLLHLSQRPVLVVPAPRG